VSLFKREAQGPDAFKQSGFWAPYFVPACPFSDRWERVEPGTNIFKRTQGGKIGEKQDFGGAGSGTMCWWPCVTCRLCGGSSHQVAPYVVPAAAAPPVQQVNGGSKALEGKRYSTCTSATLKLVLKGSPDACRLDNDFGRHKKRQLVLKNSMAIGPKWENPQNFSEVWDYIDLGVGTYTSDAIEVHLNDRGFIVWNSKHGEMVFDIAMWKLVEGTKLVLLKGVGSKSNNTMNHGDNTGRLFMQNDDGTISPTHAKHLVLGATLNATVRPPLGGARDANSKDSSKLIIVRAWYGKNKQFRRKWVFCASCDYCNSRKKISQNGVVTLWRAATRG